MSEERRNNVYNAIETLTQAYEIYKRDEENECLKNERIVKKVKRHAAIDLDGIEIMIDDCFLTFVKEGKEKTVAVKDTTGSKWGSYAFLLLLGKCQKFYSKDGKPRRPRIKDKDEIEKSLKETNRVFTDDEIEAYF